MPRESLKKKKERSDIVLRRLSEIYPDIKIQLNFNDPFELLVATILSAQCTDARVNQVTSELFAKYKTPEDYLKVPNEALEKDIYSTGFYKAKAKNIRASAKKIIEEHDGEVPDNMDELIKLPGVGRKTANVVLGHCFDIPGIVVDTHVKRIANRLKLTTNKDPVKIEYQVKKLIKKP